jgi:2-dehydro-3-deoxyphosphogluconate aldolase/(4S)-4-hydroxy-2-oxoglutarate aldolase
VEDFVALFGRERATAIVRDVDQTRAAAAMEAAVRGGFRVVEFTLTTPGALELVADFARRDGLTVGAGTVTTAELAERAVRAGARFLVSPVFDETVIAAARALGVATMPGTFTPTEMLRAHCAGAPLVKLFPAPADGPGWVEQVLGPLPFLRIVPTAGVGEHNARAHLEAGAFAVGFVRSLFAREDMAARRWDVIEARARRLLDAVRGAAPPSLDRSSRWEDES